MKVKLDENVTVEAVEALAARGHDVHTVADEDLTGHPDSDIWSACLAEQRLLVTFDVGFGDVRVYPPESHVGVLVLRLTDQRPDFVLDVLSRFLAEHRLEDLSGCLVVVTDTQVRLRRQ